MKVLDLTGQKFGKLTAIKKAKPRNDRYTRWICKCECGNISEVRTDYLRNGHTTSCGCTKAQHFKKFDLTNQRFGRLVVLDDVPPDKKKCLCDCGNIVDVETCNLTSGNTQSCGCLQRDRASESSHISLIGQRFGKLQVIKRAENNRFGHVCYHCKCDCGGETIVDATNLRNGNTSSCGCIKSKGEMIINNWLLAHNIEFLPQYSLDEIVYESGRRPYFDFAIFENNKLLCLIEYNGKQHYEPTGGWNTEEHFKITQYRDWQKRKLCKQSNIPLYEISYNEDIDIQLNKIMREILYGNF